MIPLHHPVTIECQGPLEVDLWRLEKKGSSQFRYLKSPASPWRKVNFTTLSVTPGTAGKYCCRSSRQTYWSECSEFVEIQVAGIFKENLSLSAWPSAKVITGSNVTLDCSFEADFDRVALSKDGDIYETRQVIESVSINFSTRDAGTYQCYGSHSEFDSMWSVPSNPVTVRFTGPAVLNPTTELHIRLSLAGLVLLALVVLLVEDWHSRRRPESAHSI
ncbi:PREDICTED: leukocyte immunoglobulin-like receptor subfamily A member 6-like [Elephantulus edwardii]|uniref:leukocyte immunoglobulin-like receptor subfamily A member 6-like n=1 Tax=Elephantulus edwardii TaxID=28737 RepID=UPI0003F0A70E|nr:PREDICTED: leukocyte immunoglobulin-like receptor subfamily A member 6-like [Elephantulus edwardii]